MRPAMIMAVLATSALANPVPLTLMWDAPPECPDSAKVWMALAEQFGRTPARADGNPFTARGVIQRTDEGFRLELQTLTSSGAGMRTFVDQSCDKVTEAGVLSLALAIDPDLQPSPPIAAVPERALWLSAGPQVQLGITPYPSFGLSVLGTIDLDRFAFAIAVGTSFPQRLPQAFGKTLRVSVPIEGSGAACLGFEVSRLSIDGCVALRAALVLGEAEGVAIPILGRGTLLSIGPRVQTRVLLTNAVAIGLNLEGSVALLRPSFRYADGSEAFTTSLGGGSAVILVELKIW